MRWMSLRLSQAIGWAIWEDDNPEPIESGENDSYRTHYEMVENVAEWLKLKIRADGVKGVVIAVPQMTTTAPKSYGDDKEIIGVAKEFCRIEKAAGRIEFYSAMMIAPRYSLGIKALVQDKIIKSCHGKHARTARQAEAVEAGFLCLNMPVLKAVAS